jgi:hypothetical protein
MESFIKPKTNRKTIFTKNRRATHGSNKILLQEMPIHRAIKNFFALQILQPVGVVQEYFRDLEGPNPEGIELVVFPSILPGCIPLKH